MTRLLIILYIIGATLLALIVFSGSILNVFSPQVTPIIQSFPTKSPTPPLTPTPEPIENLKNKSVTNSVPFVLQAPLGEWGDPRQQDACEEASVMMAVKWLNGEKAGTPNEHRSELIELAEWQTEMYGDSRDTSAQDTLDRLLKKYFQVNTAQLKKNTSADDIIRELHNGNLVIVPMNGQALNNPYFTQPGPERHMVLVTGYDANTNEFITNDPGIGVGENYRYPINVFESAIRDYYTGYHVPIDGIQKDMIIISK